MHLINKTPYDTRVLRRAVVAGRRFSIDQYSVGEMPGWWKRAAIYVVLAGARDPRPASGRESFYDDKAHRNTVIRVHPPTGDEWQAALRGIAPPGVLTPKDVALAVVEQIYEVRTTRASILGFRYLRNHPVTVPLKVVKERPPRNLVQERYGRALALQKLWARKLKLATTKVKLYRAKVARYAKEVS